MSGKAIKRYEEEHGIDDITENYKEIVGDETSSESVQEMNQFNPFELVYIAIYDMIRFCYYFCHDIFFNFSAWRWRL